MSEFFPEGATHLSRAVDYYKMADCGIDSMYWHRQHKRRYIAAESKDEPRSAIELLNDRTLFTPIAHEKADADGWVSNDRRSRPVGPSAMVEVEFRCGARSAPEAARLWDWCETSGLYTIVAWRPAQEAQKAEAPKPTAPPFVRRVRAAVAGGVMDSDRAGIDAFTAPPEREPSPVKHPRVSTIHRTWRWL